MDEKNPEEAVEATDSTEEVVPEETTDDLEEVVEEPEPVDVREAPEFKQVLARAHKAEAELKSRKEKEKAEAPPLNNNTLSADDVDVKILQSQGMSDDLIKELQALAKVRGTSILATQLDPIFVAIKETKEAEEKNAKASLGASKGSGQNKPKKGPQTPGLSQEEHKELWQEAQKG